MDVQPPRSSTRRIGNLLILLGLIILLLWAGLKAWRVYEATQSLLAIEPEARALAAGGISSVDPEAAEALVLRAREDIVTLYNELGIIRPLAPYLGWVPRLGPTLVASPYLLEMADAGSEAGAIAVSSLKPALAIVQEESFSSARLGEVLPIITGATADLALAENSVERYGSARAGLENAVAIDTLPWRVRQMLQMSDQWLPIAEDGLRILPGLPSLLGQDSSRRYLILAQNEDEMRATGGFITGAGVITVQNGQIVDLNFTDANNIDNWREKPYAFPPQPFYDFMRLELFGFRDANYWPDFRISAQKAIDLYVYGQDVPPFDGVIAIDQEFLRLLVEATGPVPIPGTDQSIDANNLLQTLRQARDIQEGQEIQEWVRNRKAFLGGFAAAIQAKLETDFNSLDLVKLAANLTGAAENRHLTIFMHDPALAAILAENGWDGRVPEAPPGDFLMAIDTNMGYNKANVYVDRALDYEVNLAEQPRARLMLTYTHTGPTSGEPCYQGVDAEFEEAAEYLAIADQCYWNFLRVYTPKGSQLVDSSRHVVPGETLYSGTGWESAGQLQEDLPWLTTFSNFMLLPRAEQITAFFQYNLPTETITELDSGERLYSLSVQKQPGMRTEKLVVTVVLPESADLLEVSPPPVSQNENRIVFEIELDSNKLVTIRYH